MEAHSHAQVHLHERRASVATRTILQVGALAGIAAGLMYAAWQMVVAAIVQDPTAVPGIHQTLWTPPEGIWSVVFGVHHFHGSFHFIPVFGGIVAHLGNALVLGILGVALLTAILGRRPNPRRGSRARGRLRHRRRRDTPPRDHQHAKDSDALQRIAALELVGRPRNLRCDARLARQRAAEKEQRQASRGATRGELTPATPFSRNADTGVEF